MDGAALQVCICGWHYYPEFYKTLFAISDRYKIVIIANREGDTSGLPCVPRENSTETSILMPASAEKRVEEDRSNMFKRKSAYAAFVYLFAQ